MPIPLFLLERIKTAAMSGPQIADAFTKMAKVADEMGLSDCAVNIEYASENDQLTPGDLVPMITLSLVRQSDTAVVQPMPAEAATDIEDPHPEE